MSIAVHPRYKSKDYLEGRATADVALLKLTQALPVNIQSVAVANQITVKVGDRLMIAGYGVTAQDSDAGAGVPRQAELVVTGRPGNLQIRLVDPVTRNRAAGLGACTGDSGGPAFKKRGDTLAVVGIVSWSTGPNNSSGCGGLTGVTPLTLYHDWIVERSRQFKSPIMP
jgi:secreted trypsin-like serine protease